jgi:hypothetical protein
MKDIVVIVFALSHNVFLFMLPLFPSNLPHKEGKITSKAHFPRG